eukprot:jgi/Picre1/27729/NNA_000693.t1
MNILGRVGERRVAIWNKARLLFENRAVAFSTGVAEPVKVCIVGSGPAGFYSADKCIAKRLPDGCHIDILEALPCPYGLVRSGVAPDHPDTKNVMHHFQDMMERKRVEYFGNVRVGKDVSLDELRGLYHAVVLAYGAGGGKRLSVEGSGLKNIMSARDFVNWYNGHPSDAPVHVDMAGVKDVLICGLGNVALDCARVLLKKPEDMVGTDISTKPYDAIRQSPIERVRILARRGPAQAACTPKELRELLQLPHVETFVHPEGCLELTESCKKEIASSRIHKRVVDVLTKSQQKDDDGRKQKELHVQFLSSPVKWRSSKGHWDWRNGGVSLSALIESVGYVAEPLEGAPFDPNTNTVPNVLGKVVDADDLYVCGWLKRGPSGIIGTNLVDAEQTVDTMVRHIDIWGSSQKPGRQGLMELLESRNHQPITYEAWKRIDEEEISRGQAAGKLREKLTSVQDMISIANNQ